ncbi:MAG: AAA family ATPase, partial [Actinomycetota bacterium]|nr:AAA family ATPase [Actinomycetota bacterium]
MGACVECGRDNPASARFCVDCGTPLAPQCAQCGAALVPGGKFCAACGTPVSEEERRSETIKLVTILFADVVGSTAMGERLAPEDTRAIIAEFFDAMSEEIRAEGGVVERLIGDAIMADFGVPVSREDDAVRAIRAALRMKERLELLNAGKGEDEHLQMRIGINTGEVSTGGSLGDQLLVMGDAVNVAARLEQAAEPGAIVIGARTARAVRGFFELRELELVAAKGKTDGVVAFLVEAEHEGPSPRGPLSAPIVGRDAELNRLHSMLASAKSERSPHVVAVVGEPGVGKTRLVTEFLNAVERDAKTVTGRCLPYGEGITLWPLREILRAEAGLLDNDPPGLSLQKLSKFVRSLPSTNLEIRPEEVTTALGITVGLEPALSAVDQIDPREVRRELISSWRCVLTAMAQERPLVVLIEDLHWADPMMLEVLGDLVVHVGGRILVVCTARPDHTAPHVQWAAGIKNYSSVYLDPLTFEESVQLVSLLLGIDVPEQFAERVLATAEGNPFFIEEILHRLIDDGRLELRDDAWHIVTDVTEIEVPDNVQAVIQARIETLSPDERRVLQHAAVVGRTFWGSAVGELAQLSSVEEVLGSLVRKQFVSPRLSSSMPAESEFTFKHILIRDIAYDSLPRAERGKAHAALARWVESQRSERATELADLLAHHYERAYHWSREESLRRSARAYSLEAAHHGLRRFAIAQAEVYGRQAVALSRGPAERIEALEALGAIYKLSSKGDAAWTTFVDALTDVTSTMPIDDSALARLASKAAIGPTRFEAAMNKVALPADEIDRVIEAGLRSASDGDSPAKTWLLVSKAFLRGAGYVPLDAEGTHAAEEALRSAERMKDPNLISAALDAVGQLKMADGRYADFDAINRRRIELVPQLTDMSEVCDVFGVAAFVACYLGRYQDTIRHATSAIERSRGIEPSDYWHGLIWRIQAKFMAGDWNGALEDQAELEREHQDSSEGPPASAIR